MNDSAVIFYSEVNDLRTLSAWSYTCDINYAKVVNELIFTKYHKRGNHYVMCRRKVNGVFLFAHHLMIW